MARKARPTDSNANATEPKEGVAPISKAEAIRRAIAAGVDAPADGVDYILKHFGLDVSPQHFSTSRSLIRAKARDEEAERLGTIEGILSPPKVRAYKAIGGEENLLAAMEALKPLVATLGVEKVKRIAELLG